MTADADDEFTIFGKPASKQNNSGFSGAAIQLGNSMTAGADDRFALSKRNNSGFRGIRYF